MDQHPIPVPARRLAAAIEPFAGSVYFAPECHQAYAALGFDGSRATVKGVEMPDPVAYFTSRGSVMGQVNGQVVAATFGVFNPAVVVPSVELGWTRTDAPTICAARDAGAIAQLERILGPMPAGVERVNELLARALAQLRPEGRALYAGLSQQSIPESPLGAAWRRADLLREYRGDSHTAAWISAGLDATQIGLLSECYWGVPLRSYSRSRAWTDAQFDAAQHALVERGLLDDNGFTAYLGWEELRRMQQGHAARKTGAKAKSKAAAKPAAKAKAAAKPAAKAQAKPAARKKKAA